MTQPIQEPSVPRKLSAFGYGQEQLFRRPGNRNLAGVVYCIKVFADWQNVRVADARYSFFPDEDIDGFVLSNVEMYVTTVSSSGIVQCQIRRGTGPGVDVLSTRIQCDASEKHSSTAATPYVINAANDNHSWPEQWNIDVDAAGTNAKGLGIHLTFSSA